MIKLIMATFVIGYQLTVGAFTHLKVNEIKVSSSWEELADTATLKLPLLKGKINIEEGKDTLNSLADQIHAGDRVEITMSYKGLNKDYEFKEFNGFVKRVTPAVPLVVECEDAVYLLRKVNLENAWKQTTLKEVVQYIVDETNKVNDYKITLSGQIPDVRFEKFRLDNVNGAEALQTIKEQYGLVAFFNDLELFVGLAYTYSSGEVKYSLASPTVINSNLTWRRSEDTKIKLKAISILKDNTQLSVEVPEKGDGEQRTQFYYNITDMATLKAMAEKDIEKLKFEGYEGDLESFLVPYVRHSMAADILDPDYEQRQGRYMVDSVETTLGKGIRRRVKIGKRL